MIDWMKARLAERTSWDGVTIVAMSLMVLVAAPILKMSLFITLALVSNIVTMFSILFTCDTTESKMYFSVK